MKHFNIISNIHNGAGLEIEVAILHERLAALGHRVTLSEYTALPNLPRDYFDVNVFVEVVMPQWLNLARQNWLVPNTEWYFPEWDYMLPAFDKVLCKHHEAYFRWKSRRRPMDKYECIYTGFESRDRYFSEIKADAFLHLAGKSSTKNTRAVVAAWYKYQIEEPLFVSYLNTAHPDSYELAQFITNASKEANVVYQERWPDHEVTQLMNRCAYHVMPSAYEGWGHVLHEGLSCGAIMLTTDAAPMNEWQWDRSLLVPVVETRPLRAAVENIVSADGVFETVRAARALSPVRKRELSFSARNRFDSERMKFRARFAELVEAL